MKLSDLKKNEFNSVFRRWKVLVIEARPELAEIVRSVLDGKQFEVSVVGAIQEAEPLLKRSDFDVVVIDCEDRFETSDSKAIRKALAPLGGHELIVLTGEREPSRKFRDAGLRHLIDKSVSRPELKQVIESIVDELKD